MCAHTQPCTLGYMRYRGISCAKLECHTCPATELVLEFFTVPKTVPPDTHTDTHAYILQTPVFCSFVHCSHVMTSWLSFTSLWNSELTNSSERSADLCFRCKSNKESSVCHFYDFNAPKPNIFIINWLFWGLKLLSRSLSQLICYRSVSFFF